MAYSLMAFFNGKVHHRWSYRRRKSMFWFGRAKRKSTTKLKHVFTNKLATRSCGQTSFKISYVINVLGIMFAFKLALISCVLIIIAPVICYHVPRLCCVDTECNGGCVYVNNPRLSGSDFWKFNKKVYSSFDFTLSIAYYFRVSFSDIGIY